MNILTSLCFWLTGKNGVYINLVRDVRNAFKVDDLVKVDCQNMNPSDFKKIGAKLKVKYCDFVLQSVFVHASFQFVLASSITIVLKLPAFSLATCV